LRTRRGLLPYLRTVKTASGATAMQVLWSSRRGLWEIEHPGQRMTRRSWLSKLGNYKTADTEAAVMTTGIPVHTERAIEAIGSDSTAAPAGSWTTDHIEGTVWYTAGTALSGNHLSKFVITVAGHPALTIQA
jgi:hypothetical protein